MLPEWLQNLYFFLVEKFYQSLPQKIPSSQQLSQVKLIAHRGCHDNVIALENTEIAFDKALEAGIEGIECDVRWTLDLKPIVFHDPDFQRVYRNPAKINQLTVSEIKEKFPSVLTLEELIRRYGKKLHLMIEIKHEDFPNPQLQRSLLASLLAELKGGQDYHFLSLVPEDFEIFNFAPKATYLPVAKLNVKKSLKQVLNCQYGGLTGHYSLFPKSVLDKLNEVHLTSGTGQVDQKAILLREINRGVGWIFSNQAVKMRQILNDLSAAQ